MELADFKDGGVNNNNNAKKKVETPPPSYSSLEISVQCGPGGNTGTGGGDANAAAAAVGATITGVEHRAGPTLGGDQVTREQQLQLQQPQQVRLPQQHHFQTTGDRLERTERPPSYDTALCRLAENAAEPGVEERGAVGGVSLEPLPLKLTGSNDTTKEVSTRTPSGATSGIGSELASNANQWEQM